MKSYIRQPNIVMMDGETMWHIEHVFSPLWRHSAVARGDGSYSRKWDGTRCLDVDEIIVERESVPPEKRKENRLESYLLISSK